MEPERNYAIVLATRHRVEARFLIRLIFQDFASFSKAFKSISRAPPCEKTQIRARSARRAQK